MSHLFQDSVHFIWTFASSEGIFDRAPVWDEVVEMMVNGIEIYAPSSEKKAKMFENRKQPIIDDFIASFWGKTLPHL